MMNENHASDPLEFALTAVKQAVPEPEREAAQRAVFLNAAQAVGEPHEDIMPVRQPSTNRSARQQSPRPRLVNRFLVAGTFFAVIVFGLFAILPSLRHSITLTALDVTPPLNRLQPIAVDNAAQLQLLTVLGRGAINTVEYAPDGRTLAVATTTGVYLHDTSDWGSEPTLLGDQRVNVSALAYSDDGTRLAAAQTDGVSIWDTTQHQVTLHIPAPTSDPANIILLDFSSDGETLRAFACSEAVNRLTCDRYRVYVWGSLTGEGEIHLDFPVHQTSFFSMSRPVLGMPQPVFSPDDQWLAVPNMDESVLLYDPSSGERATSFSVKEIMTIRSLTFTPDSQQLILMGEGSHNRKWVVNYWRVDDLFNDQPTPQDGLLLVQPPNVTSRTLFEIAWAGDRVWMFSNTSQMLTLWNAKTWKIKQTFASRIRSVTEEVSLSPDGQTVIVETLAGILQIWDVGTGTLTTEITDYGSRGNTAQFDSSRSVLLNIPGYNAGALHIWSLDGATSAKETLRGVNPTVITIQTDGGSIPVTDAVLYEDEAGQRFVAYMGDIEVPDRMQGIWRYNLDTLSTAFWMESDQTTRGRPSFRADGTMQRLRVVGNSHKWLAIKPPDYSKEYTQALELGRDDLLGSSAAFSPDGRLLAATVCQNRSICKADEIRVWDTLSGRLLARLDLTVMGLGIRSNDTLYFSSDGRYVAAHTCYESVMGTLSDQRVCYDGQVQFWDTTLFYERLTQLPPPEVTPEPDALALNFEQRIRPLAITLNLENYPYGFSSGAFSPVNSGGDYIVAVTDDRNTTLYSVNPETSAVRLLSTVEHSGLRPAFDLNSVGGGIPSATFSTDGALLAISGDGTIQLWGVPMSDAP